MLRTFLYLSQSHIETYTLCPGFTHRGYPFHHTSIPEDNAPFRPWVYQLQSCYFHRIKSRLPLHYYLTLSPQRSTQLSICKLIHDYVRLYMTMSIFDPLYYLSGLSFIPPFGHTGVSLIFFFKQAPNTSSNTGIYLLHKQSSGQLCHIKVLLKIGFWSSLPTPGSSGSLCHHYRQAPLQVSTTKVSSSSSLQARLWTDPLTSSPPYYCR